MILLSLNIIFFIADFYTTWLNRDLLSKIEVNPLYQYTGTLLFPVLLNIVIGGLYCYLYFRPKTKPWERFIMISSLTLLIGLRCLAIYSALTWLEVPPVEREVVAASITEEHRTANLYLLMFLLYTPLAFIIASYLMWRLDHKVSRRDA